MLRKSGFCQCLPGVSRHIWAPLTKDVAAMLGLEKEASSPQEAFSEWQEAFPNEAPPGVPATQDFAGDFLPSEEGWPVRLLDGVMSRMRYRRDPSEMTGYAAEWRVANRSFPVVEAYALEPAVKRVTDYFSTPHMTIGLTEEATKWHQSFQGGLNVQSHVARERGDTTHGARLGAAPWQTGVIAALLLVYEIFVGVYSLERLQQRDLQVTPDHLKRAFSLITLVPNSGFQLPWWHSHTSVTNLPKGSQLSSCIRSMRMYSENGNTRTIVVSCEI